MKALLLFFCASALSVYADWKVLPRGNKPAEIAVDFEIESLRIDPNGDSVMTVASKERNEETGFALKIAKPIKGEITQIGKEATVPVWRCDIEIKSTGELTTQLVAALRQQLTGSDKYDAPLEIVAPYSGFCTSGAPDIACPSIYFARGVGLVFDASNKMITGDTFDVTLIVDAPMRSLRVCFSVPEGYGGRSPAQQARSDWRDAKTEKEANSDGSVSPQRETGPRLNKPGE